jgi:serine protease Do
MNRRRYWPFFGFCLLALAPSAPAAREVPDFSELVRRHGGEVVNISTAQTIKRSEARDWLNGSEDSPLNDWLRDGPGRAPEGDGTSLGSGFVISQDGYILTCAHVVDGATEILVRLTDRREFRARLIGADRRSDVALLKIDAENLPQVSIGDPGRLAVGDWVLAIGSPFGFDSSATSGIVSAKGRSLPSENYVPFIQTDVAINPGNSGGPLFNLKGEVVGVNSQIYSRTGVFMGLSFAIPIDIAMRIVDQLKADGRVRRGWLGVSLQEVSRGLADAYGLDRPRGALIADILPSGPAMRSELRQGDIVLEYEGRPINVSAELPPLVGLTAPEKRARLKVFRRNQGVSNVTVTVGELRDDAATKVSLPAPRTDSGYRFGLSLSELTPAQRKRHDTANGISVDDVLPGPAHEAGLRAGDVIMEVEGRTVAGVAQFYRLLAQAKPGRPALLRIRRGPSSVYVALPTGDLISRL